MPSTYSGLIRLELMQTGEKSATWGDITNTNLGTLLEKSIAGAATVDVTGSDVTLTALNGTDDQARCAVLLITGAPGVARNVVAPATSKTYVVINSTAFAATVKSVSSTGVSVAAGERTHIAWNGSDFVRVGPPTDSPTFTGTTTVDTLLALGAVTLGNAPGDTLTIAPSSVSWSNNPTHSGNHTFSGTITVQGAGGLNVSGNTVFGDAAGDSITINPSAVTWTNNPTHSGNHTFSGTVTFSNTLTTNGALTANGSLTANGALTANGSLTANGAVVLGDAAGDAITINPSAVTWANNPTHSGNHTFSGNVTTNGNTTLGNATTDTLNVGANGIVKGADGRTAFGAASVSGIGAGTDQVGIAGSLGLSGAQVNVNPATDFEMVHRSTGGWRFYTDSATKAPFKIDRLAPTDSLQLTSAGVKVGGDGRLYGLNLHNNAGSVTGTTNQYVASGTYTPSASEVSGVSNVSAAVAQWLRVGNVVTVSGECTVDPTGVGTNMRWTLSLPPVGATVSATNACCGTASGREAGGVMLVAKITGGSNLAVFDTRSANDNASYNWSYTYTFLIS